MDKNSSIDKSNSTLFNDEENPKKLRNCSSKNIKYANRFIPFRQDTKDTYNIITEKKDNDPNLILSPKKMEHENYKKALKLQLIYQISPSNKNNYYSFYLHLFIIFTFLNKILTILTLL